MTQQTSAFSRQLWAAIGRFPGKAFWVGRSGTHSYADLSGRIGAVTRLLGSTGVSPGGIVLIVTPDDWAAFCAWVGCLLNGAVPVLLAPDTGQGRLSGIMRLAKPALIITGQARRGEAWAAAGSAPVVTDAALSGMPADAGLTPSFAMADAGTAYVLFTSGSTSAPKGAMVTHDSLGAQIQTIARVFRVRHRSRLFNGLVLYHVDGLLQGPLLAAAQSATLVRPGPFLADRLASDMDWLAAERATHMVAAPALLDMIDRFCPRDDYFSHPDFTAVLCSSAKLPAALWDRFETRFPVALINEYGMTETVAASHFAGPFPEMGARHSIGRPVDCQARVVDPEGKECAPGEAGELQIKGKNIFAGYFGDPDRTRGVFQGDWFRTGDLARVTGTGDFEIAGRLDAAINTGGFLLFPEEIDEVLRAHPEIGDAQTVGVADDIFGQVAYSAYVAGRPIDPADVMAYCRENLEARKIPKRAIQIAKLPRTGSGKPDTQALRTLLLERGSGPGGGETTLEMRILRIAGQVFGVPPASLAFSDTPETVMGWDSYAHTALLLEVEQDLGIEISTADMLSIGSLSDLLRTAQRVKRKPDPENAGQLRRIRAGTGEGCILAFPGMGGHSLYIRRFLGSLDKKFEVQAISFPADAGQREEFSIRNAAHGYAAEIRQAGLSQPFVLIGPSFAGFLAYETAVALAASGLDVAGAIVFDTAVPWTHRRARHLHRIAQYLREIRHLFTMRRNPKAVGDPGAGYVVPGFGSLDLNNIPEAQRKTVRRSFAALANYKPSRAHVPMLIFAAQNRRQSRIPMEPNLGWGRFNSGPITTIYLGEDHVSIIRNDHLASLVAKEINRFLSNENSPPD